MDWSVLLLILHLPFEPLQSYYQDGRQLEYLDSLYSLLVLLTLVAVPLVLPTQLLWSIELTEAVGDCHLVYEELSLLLLGYLLDLVLELFKLD